MIHKMLRDCEHAIGVGHVSRDNYRVKTHYIRLIEITALICETQIRACRGPKGRPHKVPKGRMPGLQVGH